MPRKETPLHATWRPPDPFRCDVREDGGTTYVELEGELDLDTVGRVRERLSSLQASGHKCVVLDLSRLKFMDSTGLRLVIEADAAARRDGFDFEVIPGDGPVRRLIRLSGVDGHLPLRDG